MFTRKISAIVGTLLTLLTLVGTSTTAQANEIAAPENTATPEIYCSIFLQCS